MRQTNFDNGTFNTITNLSANAIDVTEIFCDVVGFAEIGVGVAKLFKKNGWKLLKNKGSMDFSDLNHGKKNGIVTLESNIKQVYANAGNDASGLEKVSDLAKGSGHTISTSGEGFGELQSMSSLNKRQRGLLDLLNEPGTTTIISKKSVSMNDLRQLTGVTGDEFNMFTQGGQRLIIRGQGNQIRVSQEMYDDLLNGAYGKFSGHTHPFGYSLEPGPADEPFLKSLGQKRSSVWGAEGDGWLPFGQEPWLTEEIRQEIRREAMAKLYGGDNN